MKKYNFLLFAYILFLAVSCDFTAPGTGTETRDDSVEINLTVPGNYYGMNKKSRATSFETGYTAWIRAFDSNRNRVAIGGAGSYDVTMQWYSTVSKWGGRIDLSGVSGATTFLAIVFDASGQVKYRGWQTITISDTNRNDTITLEAALSFALGEIGPGGGYVFYDNPTYATDGWRYLEAAPVDFSYDWTVAYLDSDYIVHQGDMYQDSGSIVGSHDAGDTLIYTKKDFYWGPAGKLNTQASLGQGSPNFVILDGASSATPKIRKGNGRKALATEGNARRDTPDSMKAQALNGITDWFIPSESELTRLHVNKAYVPGISEEEYWSSTEATTVTKVETLDIPNARSVHMGTGTASDQTRDSVSYVRPVRRFK